MYPATIKFINLGDHFHLPKEQTEGFTQLQEKISRGLRNTQLRDVPGFLDVVVTKFYRWDGFRAISIKNSSGEKSYPASVCGQF